ncbi:Gfo/Idh/MocA family oxidoreductase [Enterococcus sp. ALS3]|uniref:Gfo/Idh/MocA family oxidoreductase n=1 Tax=Enterococcus alishanensis TaxID=1303817 RepID=A0ABS6T9A8_9ENTE|nr:Gfo/Idh/MocA family oxidoreductase [Enterococcus alishanensis]MBV7389477.1 Gfo/Idh/MocA family oxidoreductase [Enterococcus alishanensis]
MKIGVIGIGGIAQKAYLPTYLKIRNQADFYFASSNEMTRKSLAAQFSFSEVYQDLNELMTQGIEACLIHAATKAHYQLAKTCLENNISVFIDKPISENYQEVKELLTLAEEKNLIFMAGFNRRFAPKVVALKEMPNKRTIHLEKNETSHSLATEYGIYDLFIHLVDTAVYLLDDEIIKMTGKVKETDGMMTYAHMHLSTKQTECFISMDLQSGAKYERYQVTNSEKTAMVENLTDYQEIRGRDITIEQFSDWETTLFKRGFEQIVEQFVAAVKHESHDLKQRDVLSSHRLCAELLAQHFRHTI